MSTRKLPKEGAWKVKYIDLEGFERTFYVISSEFEGAAAQARVKAGENAFIESVDRMGDLR